MKTVLSDDMELKFIEVWHRIISSSEGAMKTLADKVEEALEMLNGYADEIGHENLSEKQVKNKIDSIKRNAKAVYRQVRVKTTTGSNVEDDYDLEVCYVAAQIDTFNQEGVGHSCNLTHTLTCFSFTFFFAGSLQGLGKFSGIPPPLFCKPIIGPVGSRCSMPVSAVCSDASDLDSDLDEACTAAHDVDALVPDVIAQPELPSPDTFKELRETPVDLEESDTELEFEAFAASHRFASRHHGDKVEVATSAATSSSAKAQKRRLIPMESVSAESVPIPTSRPDDVGEEVIEWAPPKKKNKMKSPNKGNSSTVRGNGGKPSQLTSNATTDMPTPNPMKKERNLHAKLRSMQSEIIMQDREEEENRRAFDLQMAQHQQEFFLKMDERRMDNERETRCEQRQWEEKRDQERLEYEKRRERERHEYEERREEERRREDFERKCRENEFYGTLLSKLFKKD